jgi:ABC-type transporter Mla subunit MlaD
MDAQTSNTVITIAISVIAIAVVLQTISAIVSAMATLKVKGIVEEARSKLEPVTENAMQVLTETRQSVKETNEKLQPILTNAIRITNEIKEVSERTNEIVARGQAQAANLDAALTDTVGRARVQIANVEDTMDHVLRNVRDTSTHVNQGVLSPIRKVNGLVNGVSAALGFLMQGRTTVQRATHEDEMFI